MWWQGESRVVCIRRLRPNLMAGVWRERPHLMRNHDALAFAHLSRRRHGVYAPTLFQALFLLVSSQNDQSLRLRRSRLRCGGPRSIRQRRAVPAALPRLEPTISDHFYTPRRVQQCGGLHPQSIRVRLFTKQVAGSVRHPAVQRCRRRPLTSFRSTGRCALQLGYIPSPLPSPV
ncbi:hypothetical protein B0H13DRAFT_2658897, partial [Mycena leptocephala]